MSTAQFEIMRAATDRRNTVWAAALAYHARRPDSEAREELSSAIAELVDQGELTVGVTSWSGDAVTEIPRGELLAALSDDSQWHPRRLPWARRLRLIATDRGAQSFNMGAYGSPEPIALKVRPSEMLELQSLTCAEAMGMLVSVFGFLFGSAVGLLIGGLGLPTSIQNWSTGGMLGWIVGGIVGLCVAGWAWNAKFPPQEMDELPEYVVPDMYASGPDVNATDAFGDPRF